MKSQLLALLICVFAFNPLTAQTLITSNITADQVWDAAGSPYIINRNITVAAGAKLFIKPGAHVRNGTGNVITVLGGAEAIGTKDSVITIDSVKFEFTKSAFGYNFSTGTGSQFYQCRFRGHNGYMALYLDETPLLVSHCGFNRYQYVARLLTSTATTFMKLRLEYCLFENSAINSKLIWPFGTKTELEMERCTARYSGGGMMLATKNKITNNYFYDWRGISSFEFYQAQSSEITCNTFKKFEKTIFEFPIGGAYENTDLKIENNTFDSANRHFEYYINQNAKKKGTGAWSIRNNNFLRYQSASIYLTGSNSFGYVDTLDLKGNYWNTFTSSVIDAAITDNIDNSTISGVVDYSSFRSSRTYNCQSSYKCAIADFTYSANDSGVFFTDNSQGGSPYSVRWDFGDGKTNNKNKKTIQHNYTSGGSYKVSMFVLDDSGKVCDSARRLVVFVPKKCKASFYFGIDTSNKMKIYLFENSRRSSSGTKFKWDFGDGRTEETRYPNHMYYNAGKYQLCLTITDTDCISSYCDSIEVTHEGVRAIVLEDPNNTGIDALLHQQFSIYPVPANDKLMVQSSSGATIEKVEIVDINGRVLLASGGFGSSSGVLEMDVRTLPVGLCFIRIYNEQGVHTQVLSINR